MTDAIQFDPALKQLLLQATGNPLGVDAPEEVGIREVPVIARLVDPAVEVEGLQIVSRFGSIVTGRAKLDHLVAIRQHPNVASLKASTTVSPELALSVPEIRASADLLRAEFPPAGVSGRGVIIAFADWGCDFAHANLRDLEGKTRLLALWDQRGGPQVDSPSPFGYGRLFQKEQIDAALAQPDPYAALGYDPVQSDDGTGTHCTHVMDIAAGNGRAPGSSPGVAPGADLICVHLKADDTQPEDTLGDSARVLDSLRFMVDFAKDRPLVINLSLGKTGGPHDNTPLVTQAIDALMEERPGCVVVMSAGNYFSANVHSGGELRPAEHADLRWTVPDRNQEMVEMEIWYPGSDRFSVVLIDPAGNRLGPVALGEDHIVREEGNIIASIYHRRSDPNNHDHHADIFIWPGAPSGIWTTRLTGEDVQDGRYHAWIERAQPMAQARFEPECATPTYTSGTICNGLKAIAVGAYDARLPSLPLGHFSSAGPTRDGRQIPVVSAPGVAIRAARSSYLTPYGRIMNGLTEKSGTSMAAPHVSGVVALMFEAAGDLRLTAEQTREMLVSSSRLEPADSQYQRYGAGRVDGAAAIRRVQELVQVRAMPNKTQPEAMVETALPVETLPRSLPSSRPRAWGQPAAAESIPAWRSATAQPIRKKSMNQKLGVFHSEQLQTLHKGTADASERHLSYGSRVGGMNPTPYQDPTLQWLLQNAPEVILQSSLVQPATRQILMESTTAENPVAIAGLGVAVLSLGVTVFSGGDFSFRATPASYIHQNTPQHQPFHKHMVDFNIIADHPRYFIADQNFWFTLSFEYNGNDIRDAKVLVNRQRSSTLISSTFNIDFSPMALSAQTEPLAKIRFNTLEGRWDPVGSGDFAFNGTLDVHANGYYEARIQSDDNRVRFGNFTNARTEHRRAPTRVTPFWEVFFQPDSDRLNDSSIREIQAWVLGLPREVRSQVEAGTQPIVLHGYASTTASVAHNQDLARRRIENVKNVLRDFTGTNVQFTQFNHGELQARTGDRVETQQERRVRMEVTYYR